MPRYARTFSTVVCVLAFVSFAHIAIDTPAAEAPRSVFPDFNSEQPGAIHKITVADLPAPLATPSVDNPAGLAPRPPGGPKALPGYSVTVFAEGLENPRMIRTAPNGDVFAAESDAGRISVLRRTGTSGAAIALPFATGLARPFGIAFYPAGPSPTHVYVANTNSVVRFPYRVGDLKARGAQELIAKLPSGAKTGMAFLEHWTRDIVFSADGRKMYVSVGSASNVDDADDNPFEKNRAAVLEMNPDGTGLRVYASGLRNAVGLAIQPQTGQLWASVNERDGLGDDLVPDYITHVEDGAFYGWPWYYIGAHQDPRLSGKHPELAARVKTPDVLLPAHSASLGMVFYSGTQFPPEHRDSIFAAEHGSRNRSRRTGQTVIRVPLKNGKPTGEYQDFLTGFVADAAHIWGRPVAVAVTPDGALLVSDDLSNTIWRVAYGR
jgi:glucose/arabinose dehydrogenase